MLYTVIAERDGADSSDVETHTSMVDAVRDMIGLGSEPDDASGPIGWSIEAFEDEQPLAYWQREWNYFGKAVSA